MARWKSAAELCELYLVGEQRLQSLSRRGNLPMQPFGESIALYDEDFVARLFPRRDEPAEASSASNFGVLGEARLGAPSLGPGSSERADRARVARRSELAPEPRSAHARDKVAS